MGTMPALFTAQCGFSLFVALRGITTKLLSCYGIVEESVYMVIYINRRKYTCGSGSGRSHPRGRRATDPAFNYNTTLKLAGRV